MPLMKTTISILIFMLSVLSLSAERVIRVIYFQGPSDAPREAFLYGTTGNFAKVKLPRHNTSDEVVLPDSGEDFVLLPRELPPETLPPSNAPKVKIPIDWELSVLLVLSDSSNPVLPLKVQPINASDSVFGPGEIYWVNLTEIAIGGMVGDTKLVVSPRSVKITSSPKKERGDYRVLIDCVTPGESKRRWLVRQTWRHAPTARNIVFIQPLDPPRIASLYTVSFYE